MDRHALVRLAVGVVLASGCSRSPPPNQAVPPRSGAPANVSVGSEEPTVAETHRPIIITSEAINERDLRSPLTTNPPTFGNVLGDPLPGDGVRSPFSLEGPAEPPPPVSPIDKALNPLRRSDAPSEAAVAPTNNPLRTTRAIPRMAAPMEPSAGSGASPNFAPRESVSVMMEPPAAELAPAAGAPAPAAAAPQSDPYDVVQVFYGTDRQAADPQADAWPARIAGLLPLASCVLVTLCLGLVAASRRNLALWLLVFAGVGVSLGLGYQAAASTLAAVRRGGKSGPSYTTGGARGGHVELGLCDVTIPVTHVMGELEAPALVHLEIREDAARHVILQRTERLADERFYALLRQRVQASPRKELFVFVHGFNVSFEDAARRTAQIHHDLRFAGAPVFFSWPAHDKFLITYPADENNVAWSVPHLKRFLLEVVHESQARSVNLIAHSMGSRGLATALREIDLELRGESRLFNQVVLAAPDIDADDFKSNIAPAMQRTAQRLTLYASSRDDALLASQFVHRGPRAGDAGEGLVVVPGIDTIDVTAIDSSPWGHSYYSSSDPVLQDLKALMIQAVPPRDRTWLSPAERDGLTYWIFQPARTASGEEPFPR
jgi:esterase/lipase superfamily enzyme